SSDVCSSDLNAADTQDQECPEVIGDGMQGDRRQGGGDQQIQGQALDTQHHGLVDEVLVAQEVQTQLDKDTAHHGHRAQRDVAQQLDLVDLQHLLDPLQGLQQNQADAYCHSKEGDVEGERLDGGRARRHLRGHVLLVTAEQTALLL